MGTLKVKAHTQCNVHTMANTIASFDRELLRLIEEKSNTEEVKSIIQKEELFHSTDASKNTLLHTAAQKNVEITRYLIESGSKVDAQNVHGQTPLMFAAETQCKATAEVLLDAGANIELQDKLGKSALHVLVENQCLYGELLELFLQKLKIVCSNNKEEVAKKLIAAQWDLQRVVLLNNSDLTRIVLQRGYAVKIDALERSKRTALHSAVSESDVENVKVLLEFNANVNIKDDLFGRFPVSDVYFVDGDYPNKKLEILGMLLERGAIIGGDDFDDYDVFKWADRDGIKLLFQHNVHKSADCVQLAVLEKLLENENPGTFEEIHGRGFDVNERSEQDGRTLLMIAPEYGNARAVEFLLNEGADLNAVDYGHYSVISCAIDEYSEECSEKYEQCVQLLLERGADAQYETPGSPQEEEQETIFDLILRGKSFSLGDLAVAHLALQESLGTPISKKICTQINTCDRFKTHFDSSKQQLSMKVYESTTLFDLLTVITDKKFETYARNDELVSKCRETINALSGHLYFRTILQRRLSNAMAIAALETGAALVISRIMGTSYDRFPLVADNVIKYLEYQDMKNLKITLM